MEMSLSVESAEFIKKQIGNFKPDIGIVLGSGLGNLFNDIKVVASIEYKSIPNFPNSTVEGHNGKFLFLEYNGKNVVIMQGRVHYYEGYSIQEVVTPICVMKLLGIKILLLTNASGGINPEFNAGDIMIITDHISTFVPSPLIGENKSIYGERFPDMSNIYKESLQKKMYDISLKNKIDIKKGIYLQTTGPNYETPAEIKMFSILGADAVGMSTACEAMTANYLGIDVCAISLITNKASGLSDVPLTHKEVQKIAQSATEKISVIVKEFIETV